MDDKVKVNIGIFVDIDLGEGGGISKRELQIKYDNFPDLTKV